MGEVETAQSKVAGFFRGKVLIYNARNGDITTELALKKREKSEFKSGFDYLCWADLRVSLDTKIRGRAGRKASVEWHPSYFHVGYEEDFSFGGLFDMMQEHVNTLTKMLGCTIAREDVPNPNLIRRCFYSLEDQVKADLDNPEFKEHFDNLNAEYDD